MAGSATDWELLERDEETAMLHDAAVRTSQGRGVVIIIDGPAGIGKTRLLEASRELAAGSGVGVAWARASELERAYGFGVLRQLLESAVMSEGRLRQDLFKGAAALAAPLFQHGPSPERSVLDSDYATLHGLYWLLAELAEERPLLLCVDDVQWADPPSLRFLAFAARRIDQLAVSIFATRRTGDVGTDPELVSQLMTEPGVRIIRPRALSGAGVAAIVRTALGLEPTSELVEACMQSTGGNPFYLRALLGELAHAGAGAGIEAVRRITALGSEQVSEVLMRRLEAMPAGAKELARAVAVLGDGSAMRSAATLAGLERAVAEDVCECLAGACFLARREGIAFTHPIVRSSVYASLAPRMRSALHMKAAQQLERDGARVEEVARHLLHALPGADHATVATLRAAARRSLNVGAPESAAGFLSRALAEPPADTDEAAVLLELGRAEMRAGMAEAIDHLQQVAQHPQASSEHRGLAALDLGEFFMHALRGTDAIPILEAGLAATQDHEPDLAKRIEATLIFNGFGHLAPRRQLLPRLRALRPPAAGPSTDPTRLRFAALAYDMVTGAGEACAAISFAEQCLSYSGPLQGSTEATAMALAMVAMMAADRPVQAEAHADRMIDIARASGSISMFAMASTNRAMSRQRRGRLAAAEADARAVLALSSYGGLEVVRPVALAAIVEALTARGDFTGADAAASSGDREGVAEVPTWQCLLLAIVDLRLATGEARLGVEEARHFPAMRWRGGRARAWGCMNGAGAPPRRISPPATRTLRARSPMNRCRWPSSSGPPGRWGSR